VKTLARPLALLSIVALVASAVAFAGPDEPAKPSRLDAIKALAGDWATTPEGDTPAMTVSYRVTAAGSAVMETLFAGSPKEMITMYTMDGDDLVLTHYCAMGNQPRMKAAPSKDAKVIQFDWASGGNMKSRDEMHMDSLTMTFTDATHLRHDWTMWKDGKVVRTVTLEFTKKAQ
jgi:hypothetical protein